ncbi:hypothetical protein ACQY0O_001171 [Thecaphora frezii]
MVTMTSQAHNSGDEQGLTMLSLFGHNAFADIDFGSAVASEREDPKRILPDPDEDLNGLSEKTSRVASLVLARRSIAAMMGMLVEEGDRTLSHEKLILGQASPVEKVQWRAWKEGYRLPPMTWQYGAQEPMTPSHDDAPYHPQCGTDSQGFTLSCKLEALKELYAEALDVYGHEREHRFPDASEPHAGPVRQRGSFGRGMVVTPIDVSTFETRYSALCPLLRIQTKIVASRRNTASKEHLGAECELQERRCAVHLVRAYEEQLRVTLSRMQAQVELVRHNCDVIRGRASAMSAPFVERVSSPMTATHREAPAFLGPSTSPGADGGPQSPRDVRCLTTKTVQYLDQRQWTGVRRFGSDAEEGLEMSMSSDDNPGVSDLPAAQSNYALPSVKFKRFFSKEDGPANAKRLRTPNGPHSAPDASSMPPPPIPLPRAFQQMGRSTSSAMQPFSTPASLTVTGDRDGRTSPALTDSKSGGHSHDACYDIDEAFKRVDE